MPDSRVKGGASRNPVPSTGRSVAVGAISLGVFAAGMAIWSWLAPLHSAAVAPGSVNLDTYRKTVQHLEGGIIRRIAIREGQVVGKGDVMIEFDDTRARSNVDRLRAVMTSQRRQLRYIGEEIRDIDGLLAQGLAQKSRALALYRRRAELEGALAQNTAELTSAEDVVARSRIRAPRTGTVVGLQVHTIGGVVSAGSPLLTIVPSDEPLVIDARIDPNDIDVVRRGLPARVRLTPFNARQLRPLSGTVVSVSADKLAGGDGGSHYLARIRIEGASGNRPNGLILHPGMPAEVIISTGERTLLDYLIAPITRSLERAFRES